MLSSRAATDELAVKGRQIKVRAISAANFTIAVSGRVFRMATIKDEPWQAESVSDPAPILEALRGARALADIFTFSQRLPNTKPLFDLHFECENLAAIPISTYENWWKNQIKPNARNKVRKAEKSGITTQVVSLDDKLVQGISAIYNETPVRQGKRFWHYGKDMETVRRDNSTYLDRCEFVGAFLNDQLVGFLKIVYVGSYAQVMQILSLISQRDSAPTNALVAKAVEICAAKGLSHFVYANFASGKKGEDSLTEFKRSNGFMRIEVPKYYIPLTLKGKFALALGLHRGLRNLLPRRIVMILIAFRTRWQSLRG